LRQKIAEAFGRPAEAFEQVLINEYRPGAGIGWHRDKAQFDEVVGVSLLAPLHIPLPAEKRGRLGSRFADCRTALGLSALRTVADGLGAQHSAA
jgi:alkylated DNA repair dioxygenase AlkB